MINFRMNMPLHLMAFYGSIMILAVMLLRTILKDKLPRFVFPVLWAVVLVRLLVPFSLSSPISAPVPEWPFSSITTATAAAFSTVTQSVSQPTMPQAAENEAKIMEGQVSPMTVLVEQEPVSISNYAASWDDFDDMRLFSRFNSTGMLPYLYLLGIIATVAVLWCQRRQYVKLLRDSLLVEHNETINEILRSADSGHILVFTNDHIASPLVSGMIAPRIYLPSRMDFQNTELIRHILLHEVMHIRHKDNWVKSLMILALCLHWYNPLVWLMSKLLSADIEAACDAAVLRYTGEDERKSYAGSLLSMAITASRPTLLYSAFSKTEVERRIRSVLGYKQATAFLLALSMVLVFSCTAVFASGGQAPFSHFLSSYCSSDSCDWAIKADLTRDIALGTREQQRANNAILDVMETDTTNDPDILKEKVLDALSREFGVEKRAFRLTIFLSHDEKRIAQDYEAQGITRSKDGDYLYKGTLLRTCKDELLGREISQGSGEVDITVLRDRMGKITSVSALREGDAAFDRRTKEISRGQFSQMIPPEVSVSMDDLNHEGWTIVSNGNSNFSSSYTGIENLDIDISIGDLVVKEGDELKVTASGVSPSFSSFQREDGTLVVRQGKPPMGWLRKDTAQITITLPKGFTPGKVRLAAGAGEVRLQSLQMGLLDLSMGAGELTGENLVAAQVNVKGGVGEMDFNDCIFTDLSLKTGVGETTFTGMLKGKSSLNCDLGSVDLMIRDTMDHFKLTTKSGIGSIKVNGEEVSNLNKRGANAEHSLDVTSGIGEVSIDFTGKRAG